MRLATSRLGSLILLSLLALPARADDTGGFVFADSFITWIHPRPRFDDQPIGYLRAGTRVAHRGEPRVRAPGCPGGFQAIEPSGYVCLGRAASTSETRYGASLASLAPRGGPFPFEFALSMGSPAYRRLPTQLEVRRQEGKFGRPGPRPLPPHWRGHEELASGQHPEDTALPFFLADRGSASRLPEERLVRREVPFGSMIAFTSAFSHDGRKYLQSADGTIVPAERFVSFRRSDFEGVELGADFTLPVAWTRRRTTSRKSACAPSSSPLLSGSTAASDTSRSSGAPPSCVGEEGAALGLRAFTPLSGRRARVGKKTYVETRSGTWLDEADLYVAEHPGDVVSRDGKWLHFSIARGTLIAFEGAEPVFATLASPGSGGLPRPGGDALADRTTPLGTFRIQFKHRSDDMSPEQSEHRAFFIADVPHAQFFQPPFALHVAYWHESFGEPMSGGCINVSPRDGERLFAWTDPVLPPGWHGAAAGPQFGPGTWVRVTTK